MTGHTPIPAATLVLIRDRPGGLPPELLMIERAAGMAFAGGAMVFPGGRVDPGDHRLAATLAGADADPDDGEAAARIAAIRETIEEAGVAVGLDPAPDAAAIARLRAGLAAARDFAELLADEGLRIVPDQLMPFARWCPESLETRIFDTRFFLAPAPAGAQAAADGTETVSVVWATAATILADADAGRRHIIYPTRRNLERLGGFADHAAAAAQARAIAPERIVPWVEVRDGDRWLCIPADRGYPVLAQRLATAARE